MPRGSLNFKNYEKKPLIPEVSIEKLGNRRTLGGFQYLKGYFYFSHSTLLLAVFQAKDVISYYYLRN